MKSKKKEKLLKKNAKLCNLTVTCLTVMESMQTIALSNGFELNMNLKNKRHQLPIADSKWFYNNKSCLPLKETQPAITKNSNKRTKVTCKGMLVKAHQLKAMKLKRSSTLFEVEYIANYRMIANKRYYLIKWVGWPVEANTWEPVSNLRCSSLIQEFHEDYIKQLNIFLAQRNLSWPMLLKSCREATKKCSHFQKLFDLIPNNFKFVADYSVKKMRLKSKLLECQTYINLKTNGSPLIAIENEVDLEALPSDFTYILSNIAGRGLSIPNDPLMGCSCEHGCSGPLLRGGCCPGFHSGNNPYHNGLVKLRPGKPIFECNSRCSCGPSCPNRLVQKGPKYALSLFRTPDGKGWGVKALQPIPRGSFVMEYVGEIITNEEAERRGKEYDANGITYLFDLDYYETENPLTVDATHNGNISHFVNHSCSPNLQVYNVFIDNVDPKFPRIALFARKSIPVNEELTFDYQMTGDTTVETDQFSDRASDTSNTSSLIRTKCLCGSVKCRGWLV